MNVFEFLGLPEDHRNHPVQQVKHREEVPESKLTFPCYGQVKRDGINSIVVVRKDLVVGIFGRTGKKLMNVEHLESQFSGFPMGVYLGELQTMTVDMSLEMLSGVVNPNRTEPLDSVGEQLKGGMYIDFFDMLTLQAFIEGYTSVGFLQRHNALERRLKGHLRGFNAVLPFTQLNNEVEVEAYAQEHIDAKREGAVLSLDCDYECGHKGYRKTKIVRKVSYDLTCIGWEEGKGKYAGKVANLIFKWKGGKSIKAMLGKGWTHQDAEQMFHDVKYGGPLQPIGKIFAVKALMESSKGVLRLPKAGELRHDKEIPDVY